MPIHRRILVISPHLEDGLTLMRSASEVAISDRPADANPSVVGMNFGRTSVGDVARLYWFGLPYGLDYEEMWYVIGRDLLGVVLLYTDHSAADQADAMAAALHRFAPDRVLTAHLPQVLPPHQPALEIPTLDAAGLWACVRGLLAVAPPDGYTDAMLDVLDRMM